MTVSNVIKKQVSELLKAHSYIKVDSSGWEKAINHDIKLGFVFSTMRNKSEGYTIAQYEVYSINLQKLHAPVESIGMSIPYVGISVADLLGLDHALPAAETVDDVSHIASAISDTLPIAEHLFASIRTVEGLLRFIRANPKTCRIGAGLLADLEKQVFGNQTP